jgi:uncharacterized protein (DUF697 family)
MTELYQSDYEELREIKAAKIVKRYVYWSMGFGFLPIPLLDTGSVWVTQINMLRALAKHYNVTFMKNVGKSLVTTLLSFTAFNSIGKMMATSTIKAIPALGLAGATTMSVMSGASTHAIGKLFVQHFESGGTFLTLKPYKVKKHFMKLYKEGEDFATDLRN